MATSTTTAIRVTRSQIYNSFPRAGFAWKWWYYATGPDGTQFDNDSIVTLRRVLRQRYGRETTVSEPWKATS